MTNALWAALAIVAALWPGRLVGPLDGVPLDTPIEAVGLGVVGVALLVFSPRVLRQPSVRAGVFALLLWKAGTSALLTQDGWCLKFTTPQPIYQDMGRVPHAWDVRVDWRSPEPVCSALMARPYPSIERFPVWFFNLPPADPRETPVESDRPPLATLQLELSGVLDARGPGVFRVQLGEDMQARARVDETVVSREQLASGVALDAGTHSVHVHADLRGSRWRLEPTWNGHDLWRATRATVSAPRSIDGWLRPWGRYVPLLVLTWLLIVSVMKTGRTVNLAGAGYAVVMSAIAFAVSSSGVQSVTRAFPLFLISAAFFKWPRRIANLFGWRWLIVAPFLALIVAIGLPQVGAVTWYTGGDDWWMFQRFAYRIYLQGYWLEGGTPTFWFQPLYRWIAGALHIIFGDSSVGELFWDAACLLTGACFAFHIARAFAGFRWGMAAAVVTLAVFTLGPGWYLIGRGLSEITSAGFIYGAALLALRGRSGSLTPAVAAGICATFGFYSRLNNLPMMLAVAGFAFSVRQPVRDLWKPAVWRARASRQVIAAVLGAAALGLWLFTARTWYYTGVPSMLFGTQAGALSVWRTIDGQTALQHLVGSVLMVLTMNDPPRFDVRAVPVLAGGAVALLALVGLRPFRALPLNAVGLCIAALGGALVARGSAYPGRFSIHLIPVTVTLAICAISLFVNPRRDTATA